MRKREEVERLAEQLEQKAHRMRTEYRLEELDWQVAQAEGQARVLRWVLGEVELGVIE